MIFETSKGKVNWVMDSENFIWFLSSIVKHEDRDIVEKLKKDNKKIGDALGLGVTEHRGVCIAIYKAYEV